VLLPRVVPSLVLVPPLLPERLDPSTSGRCALVGEAGKPSSLCCGCSSLDWSFRRVSCAMNSRTRASEDGLPYAAACSRSPNAERYSCGSRSMSSCSGGCCSG
jgi:hypothetical protein